MQTPTLHHNGTSKEALLSDLGDASNALEAAYQALKRTAPNGRDYYPQGPAALRIAEREHTDRLRRLDAIKTEVDDLANAIDGIGT